MTAPLFYARVPSVCPMAAILILNARPFEHTHALQQSPPAPELRRHLGRTPLAPTRVWRRRSVRVQGRLRSRETSGFHFVRKHGTHSLHLQRATMGTVEPAVLEFEVRAAASPPHYVRVCAYCRALWVVRGGEGRPLALPMPCLHW